MTEKISRIKLACAPNVSLFKNWLSKKEILENRQSNALTELASQLDKVVIGDTLPIGKNSEKLGEYKTKVLRYQSGKPTMVEYQYMALYYNPTKEDYYELFHHRVVKIEEDSPREFNKKITFAEIDECETNPNPMIGARAVYFTKGLIDKPKNPEQAMHIKISDLYDERIKMLADKILEAKLKAEKKIAEIITKCEKNAVYAENWSGLVL